MSRWCAAACLVLTATRTTDAQTVHGKIVSKSDGTAVAGAIVVLLDATSRAVATQLADDTGAYQFTAPSAGQYALRVERVGFRSSISAPVLVRQGETIDVPLAIVSESVSLRAVRVTADRRCLVRPQEGVATAQLWDEARKALNAAQLTQLAQAASKGRRDPHRFAVRLRKFKRDLEPHTLEPRSEEQVELEGEAVTPFTSIDAEQLARDGYVSGDVERGSTFYAPDAAILLSDRFLDTHCFRLQAPADDRRDDLIGLAFEPVRLTSNDDPKRVDVRGVLWLDRSTAELRYLEYGYVNLPFVADANRAGGRLEFRPLPDGRWIVWRWYIRTPGFERHRAVIDAQANNWQTELVRVREDGAEVLTVMPRASRRTALATLRGAVIDSLRAGPMAGVRVFLSGTSFAALTDARGNYEIDSVPPGKYLMSVVATRLDSLLLDAPAQELTLTAGEEKHVDLGLPSLRTFSARICREPIADSMSMIVGSVRDTAKVGSLGAGVRAEWTDTVAAAMRGLRVQPVWIETLTEKGGRYALCGVSPGKRTTIRVRHGGATAMSVQTSLRPGEVRRLDFTLPHP